MNFSLSSFKHILCVTLFVLSFSNARLVVKAPDTLSTLFDEVNGIDYTILTPQNKITYKRAFIGSVAIADPTTACEPLPSLSGLDKEAIYNPVLLTTWGDCHYAQKVKNAEMAGAKMVILVLRHDMDANHPSVRQLPIETSVEVLSISKSDGDKLVEYMLEEKKKGNNPVVEITYSYDLQKHLNFDANDNKKGVTLDFWFSSADLTKASYQFLENLKEILENFGDKVVFQPHYVLWQFHEGTKTDPRCLSNGLYCDPEPLKSDRLSGEKAVLEDLRQICFREQSSATTLGDYWWQYVLAFGQECIDKQLEDIDDCRDKIYSTLPKKITQDVESTIKSSFESGTVGEGENDYLRKEVEEREKMSVDHYPAFYVNKERYTASFRNKYLIKEFICSHFLQENLPQTCVEAATAATTTTASSSDTALYVLIVLVSVLIMAVMLYCVRRTVKRQVMGRMNEEISHIVTQYKQFKDKSNSFSNDEEM